MHMTLTIRPLAPAFAAEVTGVDIRSAITAAESAAIGEALAHHLVLVFPGEPITDEQQIAFSRHFGPLEETKGANPSAGTVFARQSNIDLDTGGTIAADDRRMLYQKANMLWHSDSSFKAVLSRCSILSAREIPAEGGATEFGSTRAAYASLDPARQRELDGLLVEHDIVYSRRIVGFEFTEKEAASFKGYRHQLVQDCAITGLKSVIIGAHAKSIVGWPEARSRALLDDLLARATRPESTYRHEWRQGDVVVWDNRAVVHRATPYDGAKYRRLMQRTTISMGDRMA
jgi:alpha-ketoglutarate-dependent 2,4-dichlorophenoxyacetate dioxygenase